MKTLPLAIELSQLAIEQTDNLTEPHFLLRKIESMLMKRPDILGNFIGKKIKKERSLGQDLMLREVDLNFEKHSLRLRLAHFSPRQSWQVQGFRFI